MNTKIASFTLFTAAAWLFTGCGPKETPRTPSGLVSLSVQTDWYAQAEHGGFYQAAAKGFYRERGLNVEILQGGPAVHLVETVATGRVAFGIGRSDEIISSTARGLPLVIVSALMQHDPQALLLHEESDVKRFEDLDGKSLMASPGAVFVEFLRSRYKIKLNVIPLNFGLAQYMADKNFIQQCFITNEPFYVTKAGAKPRTLLLADSGFEPYRVIFTSQAYAREHPEEVKAFVAATIRGWDSYLAEDPGEANALILKRNENMSADLLAYARKAMSDRRLISGDAEKGERTGLLKKSRLEEQALTLKELHIIEKVPAVSDYARFDFLPDELKALVEK